MPRSVLAAAAVAAVTLAAPPPTATAQCVQFGPLTTVGSVPIGLLPPGTLTEISGVVASRHNPGVVWVHDDSGHGATLVALRYNGVLVQQYSLAGIANRDWEDIAIGPGPALGRDYLYVADIGDNALVHAESKLIRIAEPILPPSPLATISLAGAVEFRFRYPNGPVNAETLLIDPVDGTPYVGTKETGTTARLFRYPLPLDSGSVKTLVLETQITSATGVFTGGDVSPDGSIVYLRDEANVYAYPRPRGTPLSAAFSQPRCVIAANTAQDEAVTIEPDGLGILTIPEGSAAPIERARGSRTPLFPGRWCHGSGLGGARGVPGIGTDRVPVLGAAAVTIALFDGRPNATALLLLSTIALPDGASPFAGGFLNVRADVIVGLALDAVGNARLPPVAFPDDPVLRGAELHAQALFADGTAPQGVALTRGLTLRLER